MQKDNSVKSKTEAAALVMESLRIFTAVAEVTLVRHLDRVSVSLGMKWSTSGGRADFQFQLRLLFTSPQAQKLMEQLRAKRLTTNGSDLAAKFLSKQISNNQSVLPTTHPNKSLN